MGSTIITLQMYYGDCFLSDPELRELGVEQVETFGCKVNKRGGFYMLKSDADVLRFINNLKGGDFVDVYVVHQISTPLIVEDPTEVQIAQLLTPKKGKPLPPTVINVRADVSSPQPSDKNDTNIKEDQQPSVDKGKNKEAAAPEASLEDLDEDECQGQGNDFSSYHLHTSDESDVDVDAKQSDSESLYDVDENIDNLSDLDSEFVEARKSNIQEQVNKEKAARINVDEIPSGPVGIDAGFEDIYKNKRGRYEGKFGGDDLYFDSSDPGSDISEDEGDPVDSDEVVDPPARNSSTKKNGYTTGTARTATGGSGGATTSAASTGVTGGATGGATTKRPTTTSTASGGVTTGGNGGATTSAASIGVTTGGSGGATTKRPTTTSATFGGATTAETTTGGRAANISLNFASVAQPTSQFSTQQSTTSASGSNKSSKVKRGGANPGYKRPRTKKPRTADFGVLFGANGSVIERSATTDKVLHCAPLKSSVPTNIDLGYKPSGLRWKGGAAVTQKQLQEQSYKRATQSTPSTQDT
ncbi:hypothetical protein KY290_014529 [Solanum tuberosum]|uniref:Transposon MuDR mudrA n=1 Tax=Solanum tuberosum TaxID=4113 RepID=A0ABQ7VRP0_SOLTU|nr:hypothetical protein KY289_014582 [Solanum tuberosum]KAH0699714.1 hypothetical protein KY284_013929 [Solanum tuberosum]KAH0770548.1 hypothetical protein KY290_014529 [Solanum tuberosum]